MLKLTKREWILTCTFCFVGLAVGVAATSIVFRQGYLSAGVAASRGGKEPINLRDVPPELRERVLTQLRNDGLLGGSADQPSFDADKAAALLEQKQQQDELDAGAVRLSEPAPEEGTQ